ncbi:PREDICTED: D(4) dopamine receptor-like [Branchiostoma belcheri]|uniref:D(4) dopamine receptor-like n=1 Tax=Branchiostoma belcheri TaxID=7741 RepID=A0A6P4XZW5_BRABE|nr:PREDICTED: D(4) dopamine receptor-like [Branchiostoma belcheri]
MAGNGTGEELENILPTDGGFSWDELFVDNATNVTGQHGMPRRDSDPEFLNYTALLSLPLIAGTIFGNFLVIMAVYREKNLRSMTNYFIVSLAVTDALMAVLVMPLAVYFEVVQSWTLGFVMCDIFVTFDVMFCTASIFNLVAISIDRLESGDYVIYSSVCSFFIPCTVMLVLYYKILKKIKERTKKLAPKSTMSSNPSAPSVGDTIAMDEPSVPRMHKSDTQTTNLGTDDELQPSTSYDNSEDLTTDVRIPGQLHTTNRPSWTSTGSTTLVDNRRGPRAREKVSLAVIRSKFKIKPRDDFPNKREQKAINVMKIVIGVFLFCWLPFFVANVLQACQSCQVSPTMFSVLTWLGYVNSAVNPVIYTIFNPEFKKAFKKILFCREPSRRVR